MTSQTKALVSLAALLINVGLQATTIVVNKHTDNYATTTTGNDYGQYYNPNPLQDTIDLRGALNYINVNPGSYDIHFNLLERTITLQAPLPVININQINQITIDGNNGGHPVTISGNGTYRGFMIRQASTGSPVTIQNLTFSDCVATGGTGGAGGGGGGMGAGGGLFVDSGCSTDSSVILSNVTFSNCSAIGGAGAASSSGALGGGGGGGMGGAGGPGGSSSVLNTNFSGGGGGGLFGAGGAGGVGSQNFLGGGGGGGGALGSGGTGGFTLASGNAGGGGGGGITPAAIGGNGNTSFANGFTGGSSGTMLETVTPNTLGGGGGGGGGPSFTQGGMGGGVGGAGGVGGSGSGGAGGGGGSTNLGGMAGITTTGGAGGEGGGSGGGGGGAGASSLAGNGGGGGGASGSGTGGGGGYGGGGGGSSNGTGGTGGLGGGGGGSGVSGLGGFGGFGGGGGAVCSLGTAGNGGFGGGGGGNNGGGTSGTGGSGGSSGAAAGGNGAGLGGAIFVNTSGSAVNALEIQGGVVLSGSAVMGGSNSEAETGAAASTDIHVMGGGVSAGLRFNLTSSSDTMTINNSIGDDSSNTLPGPGYVSGTGAGSTITKDGPGTLILNGTNTYAAGTTLSDGILQIASDASLGLSTSSLSFTGSSTLQAGGTVSSIRDFIISGVTTATIDTQNFTFNAEGTISGATGTLLKTGTGTLSLTGVNTYMGPTTIDAGRLNVNSPGSITSDVTVNSGGNLGGNGSITGSVLVNPGAAITPGTSIGTLSIIGPLTLTSGSTTNIEVSPTAASVIAVSGAATIAGTLNVIVDPGKYSPNLTLTFLTATGGTSGMFSSVLVPVPRGFAVSVTGYGTTSLQLVLRPLIIPVGSVEGRNAKNLAAYLNTLRFNPPIFQDILTLITALTDGPLNAALNSINPVRATMTSFAASNTMFGFTSIVDSRMNMQKSMKRFMKILKAVSEKPEVTSLFQKNRLVAEGEPLAEPLPETNSLTDEEASKPYGSVMKAGKENENSIFWIDGLADLSSQKGVNQMANASFIAGGAFCGYEYYGFDRGMVGAAAGYARTDIYFQNHAGQGGVNSYVFGPYGTAYFDDAYIELGLFGTIAQENNKRKIVFPGFSASAFSDNMAYQLTPHLSIGYDYDVYGGILEPFVTLDCVINWTRQILEKGAYPINMQVESFTNEVLRTEIGASFYHDLTRDWGMAVFREKLGYVNQAYFGYSNISAAIVGAGGSFLFNSFNQTQNFLTVGFEMLFKANNGVFGSLEYDGEFFSGYVSNAVQGKIGLYF